MEFKRAIGYLRVDTNDTKEIEKQKQAILLYANDNGYHVIDWRMDKPKDEESNGLDEVLYSDNMLELDALIIYDNKALSDDIKLYLYCLYILEKKEIKLLSVNGGFEDDSFVEKCRPVLSYIADNERNNVARWMQKGKSMKTKFGGYGGGRTPYGYSAKKGQLVINKKEKEIVEYVFKHHKQGKPMLTIADDLNALGYKTRSGKIFHASTVSGILKNEPTYRGMYKYGDMDWVKGVHEPILKDED